MRATLLLVLCACAGPQVRPERALAKGTELDLLRDDPAAGPPAVVELARGHRGYAERVTTTRAVVRVPAPELDAFVGEAARLGEVSEKRMSAEDVTEPQRDLRIRLENLEKSRQRYLALLERAQNVSEAALVERELERVTTEIERLKAQLAELDKRVESSVVAVDFSRKVRPGPVGWVFYGAAKAVKWLFVWD